MLTKATIAGVALLLVGLTGCQTDYTDNTTTFRQHIDQRLDRVAKKLDRLQNSGTCSPEQQAFVDKTERELARTRRDLSTLGTLGGGRYAQTRRRIRQSADDLEYRLDRLGG